MSSVALNNFFIAMLSSLEDNVYENPVLRDNLNVINIQENIRSFLKHNCKHELVTDYIDLTPEQSQKIVYCTKCNMTL